MDRGYERQTGGETEDADVVVHMPGECEDKGRLAGAGRAVQEVATAVGDPAAVIPVTGGPPVREVSDDLFRRPVGQHHRVQRPPAPPPRRAVSVSVMAGVVAAVCLNASSPLPRVTEGPPLGAPGGVNYREAVSLGHSQRRSLLQQPVEDADVAPESGQRDPLPWFAVGQ